jgi:16S rRNA (guanine527-N7)-methyltransferase
VKRTPVPSPESISTDVRRLLESSEELKTLGLPGVFLARMEKFAALLAAWGARANLTASPESADEIALHIIDSLAPLWAAGGVVPDEVLGGFAPSIRAIDIGSGAGFPGLILAAATQAHFTLIESRRKRASFLTVAAAEMGLGDMEVRWERAETLAGDLQFDLVTSRAVGESRGVLEAATRLLRPGGTAIIYVNASQSLDVVRAHALGLSQHHAIQYEIRRGNARVAHAIVLFRKRR